MNSWRLIWLTLFTLLIAACGGGTPPVSADVKLTGAVSKDDTTVELTFSEAVSDEAKNKANYKITPDLEITAAALSANGIVVTLTTAVQASTDYSVTVQNIKGKNGGKLDPSGNKVGFKGKVGPADIKELLSTGPTGVQISFTRPVSDSAGDAANYRITKAGGAVLPITAAALNSFKTQVNLTTGVQEAVDYRLTLSNIKDAAGNTVDVKGNKGDFKGTLVDNVPPRVTGAVATNANTIVVTFSEEVLGGANSAEFAGAYDIFSSEVTEPPHKPSNVRPQGLVVIVKAVLNPDKRSVTLTTMDQYDFEYTLKVTGVKDLAGNNVAPPDRDNPFHTKFRGKAATGPLKDSDGDQVEDMWEQVGWTVKITDGNGNVSNVVVTSDPGDPTKPKDDPVNIKARDTEGDGLDDLAEISNRFDPRSPDTDGDRLSDPDELRVWFTKADDQDTDNDGILDGNEVEVHKTNPSDADTDGDGYSDQQEITKKFTNPRIADLPRLDIQVSKVGLQLDYRFDETINNQTTQGKTKTTSQTELLAQTNSRAQENTSSNDWFVKAGAEFCFAGACEGDGVIFKHFAGAKITVEGGGGGSTSFTSSSSSEQATQQEYARTLVDDTQVQEGKSVTRTLVGGKMLLSAIFKNKSNVAFEVSDIEVIAKRRDPANPKNLIPVATFNPVNANPIGLSPLTTTQEVSLNGDNPIPSTIEEMMRSPDNLEFSVSRYKITNKENNLIYTHENVFNRTSFLEIDYQGQRALEKYRAATSFGFDANRKPKGITLQQLMEEILGLKHKTATPSGNGCTESTPANELEKTYSTCLITVNGKPTEALWRVREVSRTTGQPKSWWVLTSEGLITPIPGQNPWPGQDFNKLVVSPGLDLVFRYVEDKDGDFLEAGEEARLGSDDTKPDTDGDGVGDADEVYGPLGADGKRKPWLVNFKDGRPAQAVSSDPTTPDTDGDGLTDCRELAPTNANGALLDCTVLRVKTTIVGIKAERTDPSDRDTDGDGLTDLEETTGLTFDVLDERLVLQSKTFEPRSNPGPIINPPLDNAIFAIDPLHRDTDGDRLPDGKERPIHTSPLVGDGDKVFDKDGDTLVNLAENIGWAVQTQGVSTSPNQPGPVSQEIIQSSPDLADTDGDGLRDDAERTAGLNPRSSDTDRDSLRDNDELNAVDPTPKTNPLDADTDNDLRSDSVEASDCGGFGPTSPIIADKDSDTLVDGQECAYRTNPNKANTDDDLYRDDREIVLGTDPLFRDVYINVDYVSIECIGTCESIQDGSIQNLISGDGEFIFALGIRTPGGIFREIWNINAYDHAAYLKRGRTYFPPDLPGTIYTPRAVILREGQPFSFESTVLHEDDGGITPSDFGPLSEPLLYSEAILGGSKNKTYGPNDDCKLKITWKWTVVL